MSLHILPQSVLAMARALSPVSGAHADVRNDAAGLKGGARAGEQPAVLVQPFSCMSSGRAKASDVAAARRYYVDSV